MIGKLLGNRYEILEQLGGGGMALVWKGKDTFLNRLVTIKVLRPEYASDQDFVRRFRREAQAVASLSHPNIVSIYDVGQENESYYLVMEYIDGESLKELIRREAPLGATRVIQLGRQIADALEHAHENSIIHRDVKPHNILITKTGRAKLTDFGIAQASASTITHTDTIIGSVHYISPEQAKGEPAGPKSDIYALGVVLYEMLTGQVPYQADGAIGVALKHIQEKPHTLRQINPNVPEDLEKVVLRAMDKRPDKRHKSAKALGDDLVSISEETKNMSAYASEDEDYTRVIPGPVTIKDEIRATRPTEEKSPKKKQMKPAAWGMLAVVVLLLVAASIFALNSYLNVGEVKLPPVTGMKVDEAVKVLEGYDLEVSISRQYHETIEKDEVISQQPEAGKIVKKGRPVVLVVSDGQDLVEVPDVTGLNFDEARFTLLNLHFQVETPEYVYSNSVEKDLVAEQEPAGKNKAPRGSRIIIRISQGPKPQIQKVPNLIGLTQEAARAELSALRLELDENIGQTESNEYLSGQIVTHEPGPGSDLEEGKKVKIAISTGPGPAPKEVKVKLFVPDDGNTHEVKIETEDVRGKYNPYISTHQPGDNVAKSVILFGKGIVRVFIDNVLVDEKEVE